MTERVAADCEHLRVVTFRGELHGQPAGVSMWACADCRRRFYPACPTCVDVGHRNVEHPAALRAAAQADGGDHRDQLIREMGDELFRLRAAQADTAPVGGLREAIHRHRDGCNGRPHRRWYRGQNKCDALAALAAPSRDAGLDAAWAEAEAALPEGWDLSVMSLRMHIDPQRDGSELYAATASAPSDRDHPYTRVTSSEEGRPLGSKHDATPAAALLALAARLAARLSPAADGAPFPAGVNRADSEGER